MVKKPSIAAAKERIEVVGHGGTVVKEIFRAVLGLVQCSEGNIYSLRPKITGGASLSKRRISAGGLGAWGARSGHDNVLAKAGATNGWELAVESWKLSTNINSTAEFPHETHIGERVRRSCLCAHVPQQGVLQLFREDPFTEVEESIAILTAQIIANVCIPDAAACGPYVIHRHDLVQPGGDDIVEAGRLAHEAQFYYDKISRLLTTQTSKLDQYEVQRKDRERLVEDVLREQVKRDEVIVEQQRTIVGLRAQLAKEAAARTGVSKGARGQSLVPTEGSAAPMHSIGTGVHERQRERGRDSLAHRVSAVTTPALSVVDSIGLHTGSMSPLASPRGANVARALHRSVSGESTATAGPKAHAPADDPNAATSPPATPSPRPGLLQVMSQVSFAVSMDGDVDDDDAFSGDASALAATQSLLAAKLRTTSSGAGSGGAGGTHASFLCGGGRRSQHPKTRAASRVSQHDVGSAVGDSPAALAVARAASRQGSTPAAPPALSKHASSRHGAQLSTNTTPAMCAALPFDDGGAYRDDESAVSAPTSAGGGYANEVAARPSLPSGSAAYEFFQHTFEAEGVGYVDVQLPVYGSHPAAQPYRHIIGTALVPQKAAAAATTPPAPSPPPDARRSTPAPRVPPPRRGVTPQPSSRKWNARCVCISSPKPRTRKYTFGW